MEIGRKSERKRGRRVEEEKREKRKLEIKLKD